jgi:hypothetical protein
VAGGVREGACPGHNAVYYTRSSKVSLRGGCSDADVGGLIIRWGRGEFWAWAVPQHRLYLRPEPQWHGSLRPILLRLPTADPVLN